MMTTNGMTNKSGNIFDQGLWARSNLQEEGKVCWAGLLVIHPSRDRQWHQLLLASFYRARTDWMRVALHYTCIISSGDSLSIGCLTAISLGRSRGTMFLWVKSGTTKVLRRAVVSPELCVSSGFSHSWSSL